MRSNKKVQSKSRKRQYSNKKKSRKRRYSKKNLKSKSRKRRYSRKKSQKRRYSKKNLKSKSRKRTLSASPMDGGGGGPSRMSWLREPARLEQAKASSDAAANSHFSDKPELDRLFEIEQARARSSSTRPFKFASDEMSKEALQEWREKVSRHRDRAARREDEDRAARREDKEPLLAREPLATAFHAAAGPKDWDERREMYERDWMVPDMSLGLQLSLKNAEALAAKVHAKKKQRAEEAEAEKAEAELMAAAVNAGREWNAPTVAQLSKMLRRGPPPMSAAAVKAKMAAAHAEDALARLKSSHHPFLNLDRPPHPVDTQEPVAESHIPSD